MMLLRKLRYPGLAAILIWFAVAGILTSGWKVPLDSHARSGAPAGAFPLIPLLLVWISSRLLQGIRLGFPRAGMAALDLCVISYVVAVLGLYYVGPHGAIKATGLAIACIGAPVMMGGICFQALSERRRSAALPGADHREHRCFGWTLLVSVVLWSIFLYVRLKEDPMGHWSNWLLAAVFSGSMITYARTSNVDGATH